MYFYKPMYATMSSNSRHTRILAFSPGGSGLIVMNWRALQMVVMKNSLCILGSSPNDQAEC